MRRSLVDWIRAILVAQWGGRSLWSQGRKDGRKGLETELFPGVLWKNGAKIWDNIKMKEKQAFQIRKKPLRQTQGGWLSGCHPVSSSWDLWGVAVILWRVEPVDTGNEEGEERRVRFCGVMARGRDRLEKGCVELSLWRGHGCWKPPGPGCGLAMSG